MSASSKLLFGAFVGISRSFPLHFFGGLAVFLTLTLFALMDGGKTSPSPTYSKPCKYERTSEGLSVDCSARGLVKVPDDLPEDVTSLNLNANSITELTNRSFMGVPNLKRLSVGTNGLNSIENGTFYSLPYLTSIILDYNELREIPNSAFSRNKNLLIFDFSFNNLTMIPVNAFKSLAQAEKILLSGNNFHNLNFEGFSFINLSSLRIGSRHAVVISPEDFMDLEDTHINDFYLTYSRFRELKAGDFQHLKLVQTMDLSYNNLQNFTLSCVLGMKSLQALYVRGSNVKSISGFSKNITNTSLVIPPLKNLTFIHNSIEALPSHVFSGLSELTSLELLECGIVHLGNDSFEGLRSLRVLCLKGNFIHTVYGDYFSHLSSLHTLDLSMNKFVILNPIQFPRLERLNTLDLSGNAIVDLVSNGWNLPSLETLDLSANNINTLPNGFFEGLDNLNRLLFTGNSFQEFYSNPLANLDSLKYLDLSYIASINDIHFYSSKRPKNLLTLRLTHTRLGDLRYSFRGLKELQELYLQYTFLDISYLCVSETCAFSWTPNLTRIALRGNQLNGLFPATFAGLRQLRILDLGKCGITSLDPSIFRDLISLIDLYLDRNEIVSVSVQHFEYLTSLRGLKLETNQIKGVLDRDLFLNNKKLYFVALSNNAISNIADNTLLPMKSLDISGNPLSCSCDLQWFRHFLDITNMTVTNLNKTICSTTSLSQFVGKPLLDFDPSTACGPNIPLYISASLLILSFLVGIVLTYKFRWWLNYKWFHIKLLVVGYYELEDRREHLDYDYDINIIFPDNDEDWAMGEFLNALMDHVPRFARERIVCGEEDLPLGGMRMNAIDYVIENSFKIVAIVSNASVNDAHFLTQLQMAVEHMNEVQLEKVVMVFREDIPDNQLPYLVRLFLSKNKPYFEWTDNHYGQRLFWMKFEKLMRCNKKMNGLLPI